MLDGTLPLWCTVGVGLTQLLLSWSTTGMVNNCSLLERFRGLMIVVKYGAVIGRETHSFVCARLWFLRANHIAVFNHDHYL